MALETKDESEQSSVIATAPQQALTLEQIQQAAKCNWCMGFLKDQHDAITEANFIDTGKSFPDDGPASAVYCNECLADEFRTSQPKAAIDRNTLTEINVEDLV